MPSTIFPILASNPKVRESYTVECWEKYFWELKMHDEIFVPGDQIRNVNQIRFYKIAQKFGMRLNLIKSWDYN